MKGLARSLAVGVALACGLGTSAPARASLPVIDAPTVDLAGVLSATERAVIDQRLVALRDKTGVQMAVLIVKSLGGRPIEDYAQDVFMRWGGGSAARNDGVLFVLSLGDRRNRLHLGYGIEAAITDGQAASMLEELKPALRAGDYAGACREIVDAVRERVAHLTPGDTEVKARPATLGELRGVYLVFLLLAWLAGVFFHLTSPNARWKRKKKKHKRLVPLLPKRLRTLTVWLGAPFFFFNVYLIASGGDWALGYLVAWYTLALTGWLSGLVFAAGPIRAVVYGVFMLAIMVGIASAMPSEPLPNAWTAGLGGVALTFALCFFSCFWIMEPGSGGGSYASSGSSSWSSSSSSSSYSSSSSSSSWSGGGGSSGGGGASSSW